ncbi:AAA family ATPase [Streptomyces sp. NPDC007100]|uniref:helix-turn-helix transcriptional regulator n=1 Tax=Streptomyces sp. NPDC007100 TaxID=3155602 RepID=UPI0033D64F12
MRRGNGGRKLLVTTRLVEREMEMAALGEMHKAADEGRGRVAVITGSVASGKTEFLTRFTHRAVTDGALLLDATGAGAERGWALGLARRLFAGLPQSSAVRDEVTRLVEEAVTDAAGVTERIFPRLADTLLQLAEDRTLVLAVDDVHLVDDLSLQLLLSLAYRVRSARVLMVLTSSSQLPQYQTALLGELLSQPHCRRLRLQRLTENAVGELVAQHLEGPPADGLAAELHAATGGNPLLVRSLLEDLKDQTAGAEQDGAVGTPNRGESYVGAVLDILHRCGPGALALARGTAVLGDAATAPLLSRLLGLPVRVVEAVTRGLAHNGLFRRERFRDEAAARAVLDTVPEAVLAGLHHRAAVLLRQDGAPASEVARHLVRTTPHGEVWTVPVLREAAEYALMEGDPATARDCLTMAQGCCTDEQERIAVRVRLANVLWRTNPSALGEHLSTLVPDMAQERLAPDELTVCVGYLIWAGQFDEADTVLGALERSATWTGPAQREAVGAARQWLATVSPGHRTSVPGPLPDAAVTSEPLADTACVAHRHAASAVIESLGDAPKRGISLATRVLQRFRLGDGSVWPLALALLALVYAGSTGLALTWCERLLVECDEGHGVTWQALLLAVRGEIAMRQGDLIKAADQAESALALLPRQAWGSAAYFPLSTLVLAYTEMGRYDDAMELLHHTTPGSRLDTVPGLHFRRARGRWYLATGRFHAALGDFITCGELMRRWQVDAPELVPWRIDAADAWLAVSEPKKALALAEEQRTLTPDRERGMVLRALGTAGAGRERLEALEEAVDILRSGGNRVQLAMALGELGRGYRAAGDVHRGRMFAHKAWHTAKLSGAELLCQRLFPGDTAPDSRIEISVQGADAPPGAEALTGAEARVAVLAAHGHTNREIAAKLYVTVSTVEQHLTRIYRKLQVRRRRDLPKTLSSAESVGCAHDL